MNLSIKGGRVGIASWAYLATHRGVIPLSLAKSQGSSSISYVVTTWELSQDHKVIVKLQDPAIIKKYWEIELTAIY